MRTESISEEMLSFLETCLRYGVSFVVAGRTSSGKTTLLNSLLGSIHDGKRIYTIESGARELSLVKRDEQGRVINNVVHTLSRPSDNDAYDITQEDLVLACPVIIWTIFLLQRLMRLIRDREAGRHLIVFLADI